MTKMSKNQSWKTIYLPIVFAAAFARQKSFLRVIVTNPCLVVSFLVNSVIVLLLLLLFFYSGLLSPMQ